jgi:hypothetical protein
MSLPILRAHFDGQHIVLDEPFTLPVNVPLAVSILQEPIAYKDAPDLETERAEWLRFSAQGIARAYSDDEPEYSEADIIR